MTQRSISVSYTHLNQETIGRLKFAAFDEKLSVVGLLNGKLSEMFAESYRQDAYVTELFGWLKQLKTGKTLSQVVKEIHEDFNEKKKTEKLGKAQEHMLLDVIKTCLLYTSQQPFYFCLMCLKMT